MKTSAEFEIMVSGGRITKAQIAKIVNTMSNGYCKVKLEVETQNKEELVVKMVEPKIDLTSQFVMGKPNTEDDCTTLDDTFVKVQASKLSLDDKFMSYEPKTDNECNFKKEVEKAIKSKLKDFYCPKYDPSLNKSGDGICYEPERRPAGGRSFIWWSRAARRFNPKHGSRLGTKTEYIAFLAVLIKELIESGKSIEWAWNAVCNDSKELGHYYDSPQKTTFTFECTGKRKVCEFYDLANMYKILADNKESSDFWLADYFWLGGGWCFDTGTQSPLISLNRKENCYMDDPNSCGWIILTE